MVGLAGLEALAGRLQGPEGRDLRPRQRAGLVERREARKGLQILRSLVPALNKACAVPLGPQIPQTRRARPAPQEVLEAQGGQGRPEILDSLGSQGPKPP